MVKDFCSDFYMRLFLKYLFSPKFFSLFPVGSEEVERWTQFVRLWSSIMFNNINISNVQQCQCFNIQMFNNINCSISQMSLQLLWHGGLEKILPRKKRAFLNFQNCHYFTLTEHFRLERHVFISAFDDRYSINKATCFQKNFGHHPHPQIEIFINVIKQLRKSLLFWCCFGRCGMVQRKVNSLIGPCASRG